MPILQELRDQTADIHNSLEGMSGVDLIINGKINRDEYDRILKNNHLCYSTVEKELEKFDWHITMSSDIIRDSQGAGDHLESVEFRLEDRYEALGAAYVLLGSQLGATVIGKALNDCKDLQPLATQKFYSRPEKKSMDAWKNVLSQLKKDDFSENQSQAIIEGANKTFGLFARVFRAAPIR